MNDSSSIIDKKCTGTSWSSPQYQTTAEQLKLLYPYRVCIFKNSMAFEHSRDIAI